MRVLPQKQRRAPPKRGAGDDGLTFDGAGIPAHHDIAKALHKELLSGAWRPGQQIPTEAVLETRFGVSRGTMRSAIMHLVRAGLLARQPGRGTFVLSPQFTNSFTHFFSFERKEAEAPITYETVLLARATIAASAEVAYALHVQTGAKIGTIRRLRSHRGEPFLVEDSYFPGKLWTQIAAFDFSVRLLYEELREQHDVHFLSSEEYLTAEPADAEVALLIAVPTDTPVIRIERHAFTFNREPAEFRISFGRSDKFRYHARLR
ncbi:MAG: GntR family transcriptional regulator [Betaproteobacteria bacterium]